MDPEFLAKLVMADEKCDYPAAERALREHLSRTSPEWGQYGHKGGGSRSHNWVLRPQINDPVGLLRSARSTFSCSGGKWAAHSSYGRPGVRT